MTNTEALCQLVEGNFLAWEGLQRFKITKPPACLGRQQTQGWLQFQHGYLAYRVFRRSPETPTVWLLSDDEEWVQLIEIFSLSPAIAITDLLATLGVPELQLGYPLAAQLQRPLREPNEKLQEFVFGGKGLALLIGYAPDATARLIRVRAFAAMPAQHYQALFVDLPPVRFFPELDIEDT